MAEEKLTSRDYMLSDTMIKLEARRRQASIELDRILTEEFPEWKAKYPRNLICRQRICHYYANLCLAELGLSVPRDKSISQYQAILEKYLWVIEDEHPLNRAQKFVLMSKDTTECLERFRKKTNRKAVRAIYDELFERETTDPIPITRLQHYWRLLISNKKPPNRMLLKGEDIIAIRGLKTFVLIYLLNK